MKKPAFYKNWQFWTTIGGFIAIIMTIVVINLNNDSKSSKSSAPTTQVSKKNNTPRPSKESHKKETPKPKPKPEVEIPFNPDDYQTDITFDNLARNPKDFKGKMVKFTGEIAQIIEDDKESEIRVAINGDYDNIVYATFKNKILNDSHILDEDSVTIYGKSLGLTSYESTDGEQITIPSLQLKKVEDHGPTSDE